MGEHSVLSGSSHFWSSVMRNSRGKFFVYIGLLGAMCFVIFLLSSTHSSLKQLEGVNEKCQQQRDSLSAQLQVLYEHKNRLEKSLQQEKTDHRHTKEENEKQLHEQENKVQLEKEREQSLESQITQLKSSYSELEEERKQSETALKEQLQSSQNQKDGEIQKLQAQITELLAEKEKLQQSNSAFEWKIEQHVSEVNLCRLQYQQLESKLSECNDHLSRRSIPAINNKMPQNEIAEFPGQEKKDDDDAETDHKEKQNVSKVLGEVKQVMLERPLQKNKDDNFVDPLKNFNEQSEDAKNKLPILGNLFVSNKTNSVNEHEHQFAIPQISKNKELSLGVAINAKKDEISNNVLAEFPSPQEADKGNEVDQGNLPQVLPPNNIDVAAEKGEYGNGIHQQQLEQPDFKESNDIHPVSSLKKTVQSPPLSNNDQAAAQVKDMLGKSPADANNERRNNPLHVPPPDYGAVNKMNQFNKDSKLFNRAQHLGADDKQYVDEDDDDQDGENEDDPGMGGGQGPRGKVFQEQDFDDQEPNDNNAREEEGVMVAPK